jgi:SHS2 domain-containing protein
MKKEKFFEILSHQADLKLKVFGKTKKELFENSMIAMFEAAGITGKKVGSKAKRKIKIESLDIFSLLVDFLSEVLYLSEINDEVYWQAKFNEFSDTKLKGELLGERIKERNLIIKGVTYHDLDICKNKDGFWEATILFDI